MVVKSCLTRKRTIKRIIPNPVVLLVLVPMFLIISSSIYPAITSAIQNEEMMIISKVMAKQEQQQKQNDSDDNVSATARYQSRMQMQMINSAAGATPTSPTPATADLSNSSSLIRSQSEAEDNMMDITSIASGKAVHIVWQDSTSGNPDILYRRDGADFDPTTVNLSDNSGFSLNPRIAASSNNVHIVWEDNTPGNFDILYRRSFDGGATFSSTINLSNNAGTSESETPPAIAISGNNVHVVWDDNTPGNFDILYRRSTNGGESFTDPIKNLSNNAGMSATPAIAVSGNNVHVVWNDETPGNFDIFYRRSIDSGSTFPNIIKDLSNNAGQSVRPAIAISGNNVHVVWDDNTPGNFDILYRRSSDGGSTFPNIIRNLSDNAGFSAGAAIAVSGNNVHVVWNDNTPGNLEILYRRSIDGGSTFPNIIKNLSGNAGNSFGPAIALSSNNIYVVWSDDTNLNLEIVYRTSSNNGDTFPSLLTNLSANAGSSFSPSIAAS